VEAIVEAIAGAIVGAIAVAAVMEVAVAAVTVVAVAAVPPANRMSITTATAIIVASARFNQSTGCQALMRPVTAATLPQRTHPIVKTAALLLTCNSAVDVSTVK